MSPGPLVSIITPSFNQAEYLEDTISSVLAQDYNPIEYLIVDGASSDRSVEIIKKHAALAPDRLSWWISEPDSGQAEAINKGFQRARGEIIAWLNSDDIYLPGAIRQAVNALEADPQLGLVFGDAITIAADGSPLNPLTFGRWGLAELTSFHIICQPAVFLRRAALERAGGLDPDYHFMLDHHLWLRIARLNPIKYAAGETPIYWAATRHHPSAKNVSQAEGFSLETLRLLDWLGAQTDMAPALKSNRRHVTGGAYRLVGRYLLDGGLPVAALRAYGRSFINWPTYTLKHWHRIIYAACQALQLSGIANAMDRYREGKDTQRSEQLVRNLQNDLGGTLEDIDSQPSSKTIKNWPGLRLK